MDAAKPAESQPKDTTLDKAASDQEEPPFTLKSMVEYCWGMTFNLSHQAQQNDLGKTFDTEFFKILESSSTKFSNDFVLRLAQALRTIAFTKDAYVRRLNSNAKDLADKKQFWADITQLASFSKEGLPMQVLSFLGAGSFAELYKYLNPNSPSNPTGPVERLNNTVTHLAIAPNSSQAFTNLTHAVTNLARSVQNAPSNFFATLSLPDFLLAGAIGVVVVTILLKVIGAIYVSVQKKHIQGIQDKYYKGEYKVQITNILFNFYEDIKELVKAYYPAYRKSQMYQCDIMEWNDDQIKTFIKNKILPPDNLDLTVWEGPETVETSK